MSLYIKSGEENIVMWVAKYPLSEAQRCAIKQLHGENSVIKEVSVIFSDHLGLSNLIRGLREAFVYTTGSDAQIIQASLEGLTFGVFDHAPDRRNGELVLSSVFHITDGKLRKCWEAGEVVF